MRTAFAAIGTIIVLAAGLTGCVSNEEVPPEQDLGYSDEVTQIFIGKESGSITKYIEPDGNVLFDKGFSSTDYAITVYGPQNTDTSVAHSVNVGSTVEVEGASHPVSVPLTWSYSPDVEAIISFYNEYVAEELGTEAKSYTDLTPKDHSITDVIDDYISNKVSESLSNGSVPKVQLELTGTASSAQDARVSNNWRSQVPAWKTYEQISGPADTANYRYFYSNYCATYQVAPAVGKSTIDAAQALFPNTPITFGISTSQSELTIETAEPCDVIKVSNTYNTPGVPPVAKDGSNAPTGVAPNNSGK